MKLTKEDKYNWTLHINCHKQLTIHNRYLYLHNILLTFRKEIVITSLFSPNAVLKNCLQLKTESVAITRIQHMRL